MAEPEFRPESPAQDERIKNTILATQIRELQLEAPATVPADATLAQAVELLQKRHIGCVLVVGPDGTLAGIFTERDLLNRVAGKRLDWTKSKVIDHMTRDPESLRPDDRVAWALNRMHVGGYRNVPLVDSNKKPVGLVSVKDIVAFVVDLFPSSVLNMPPDPHRLPDSEPGGGGSD